MGLNSFIWKLKEKLPFKDLCQQIKNFYRVFGVAQVKVLEEREWLFLVLIKKKLW